MTSLKPLAVAAMLACFCGARAQDPDFYVYLCFGQSNMEGYPGIPEEDKEPVDPRFQVLAAVDFPELGREKGNWYNAVPPLCRPSSGLSPADSFGRTLAAALPADKKVGIVSVAVAGARIEVFDEATLGDYAATAPDWMKPIIATYDGNPYRYLVQMAKRAQQDGVIKGILLHQGESNAGDPEWPATVKRIYESLLRDLDLKADNVPLIAGELVSADQGGACASMNAIIGALPETIPTARVVDSEGCPCLEDRLHFTPEGYRMLGKRYAEAALPLLGE